MLSVLLKVPLLSLMARLTPDLHGEKKVIQFNGNCDLHRQRRRLARLYSHGQFSVVQEVLHRVEAGELVQDLRAVGDHARGGVYGVDDTRDVDILHVGEVGELPCSGLADCLLEIETCVS